MDVSGSGAASLVTAMVHPCGASRRVSKAGLVVRPRCLSPGIGDNGSGYPDRRNRLISLRNRPGFGGGASAALSSTFLSPPRRAEPGVVAGDVVAAAPRDEVEVASRGLVEAASAVGCMADTSCSFCERRSAGRFAPWPATAFAACLAARACALAFIASFAVSDGFFFRGRAALGGGTHTSSRGALEGAAGCTTGCGGEAGASTRCGGWIGRSDSVEGDALARSGGVAWISWLRAGSAACAGARRSGKAAPDECRGAGTPSLEAPRAC